MSPLETAIVVLILALSTQVLRALPFLVFPEGKTLPSWMTYFASQLPYASMGLLVIYALRQPILEPGFPLPEVMALVVMTLVHYWRRQTLLSISFGVIVYLLLVNLS